MKLETNIPNKRLMAWLEKNPEKVEAIGYNPGFCNNAGDGCCKYDIILTEGWHRVDGGGHRCIIEGNGTVALNMLKSVEPCPGESHDCYGK